VDTSSFACFTSLMSPAPSAEVVTGAPPVKPSTDGGIVTYLGSPTWRDPPVEIAPGRREPVQVKLAPNKSEPEQDGRVPPLEDLALGRNNVATTTYNAEVPPAPKKPAPEQGDWAPPIPGKYDMDAKAEDAEVPVHLWNQRVLRSDRAVTRSQTRSIEVMRQGCLM
jgi:hypothetical protein